MYVVVVIQNQDWQDCLGVLFGISCSRGELDFSCPEVLAATQRVHVRKVRLFRYLTRRVNYSLTCSGFHITVNLCCFYPTMFKYLNHLVMTMDQRNKGCLPVLLQWIIKISVYLGPLDIAAGSAHLSDDVDLGPLDIAAGAGAGAGSGASCCVAITCPDCGIQVWACMPGINVASNTENWHLRDLVV